MSSLFSELRRRNVFKVGTAYLVVGWLVVQITGTVVPALKLPDYTLSLVVWLGIVGFPFALLFAWAFELTPQGIKRTEAVDPNESITPQTGAKLNRLVIGLMGAAIVFLVADRIWEARSRDMPAEAAGQGGATLSSIAVLPFVNLSDDKENEYFGDGLAEELLNLLAKVPQLHVAARTSSFHFKDKNPTIAEVASALDVDTVLEGSVRRSGDTIRVVAQLISAKDSKHLWSEKYDRPITDIFKVQDDIANHIVEALLPRLGAGSQPRLTSDSGTISPELFERFLWARHRYYDRSATALAEARQELLAITAAAPSYAPAWAWLARTHLATSAAVGGDTPPDQAIALAQQAIDTALKLDPREASAYLAQGVLWRYRDETELAEQALDKALVMDPQLVDAHIQKQRVLAYTTGRADAAIAELETARAIDPLHPQVLEDLAHLLNLKDRKREAFATLERLYEINQTAARQLEVHLYSDSNLAARELFLADIEYREEGDKLDREERNRLAWSFQTNGLYDHPVIAGSVLEPVSLAVRGRKAEALAALRRPAAGGRDDSVARFATSCTYAVLGDHANAADVLWSHWASLEDKTIGFQFTPFEAVALIALLQKTGRAKDAEPVLAVLEARVAGWSPLHMAQTLWFQAMLRTFRGDMDGALEKFSALAASGFIGDRTLGGRLPFVWGAESDPRFAPVLARIDGNYAAQMAELKRLQRSGMTAAEARAEYVALQKTTGITAGLSD